MSYHSELESWKVVPATPQTYVKGNFRIECNDYHMGYGFNLFLDGYLVGMYRTMKHTLAVCEAISGYAPILYKGEMVDKKSSEFGEDNS